MTPWRGFPPSGTGTACRCCAPTTWSTTYWPTLPPLPARRWRDGTRRSAVPRPGGGPPPAPGVRFASPNDRVAVAERTADIALGAAIRVTASELHHVPQRYRRADGTSRLRPPDYRLYTTAALLDAECRLFEAGRRFGAPAVTIATVAAVADKNLPGPGLRGIH